jgi:hypothetical protein
MKPKLDLMRGFLAGSILFAFQGALAALMFSEVPEGNRELVIYMVGQLSGFVALGLGFYFQTSKSSQEKNEAISRLSDNQRPPDSETPETKEEPLS